ncbi:MAG: putative DNA-binding transcriptional regulator YafY, partial [Myxococcota bacterium]
RADRLFQIVQLLRARGLLTAERLSVELSVSKRTIYRDIHDLQSNGVPIRGEAGVGYCLERGYELPPMTFNTNELEALVLGARVVEAWGDPALAEAARSAMTKVEAVLPRALRAVVQSTAIFVPTNSWSATASMGLGSLRKAILDRRRIQFDYTRSDGTNTQRIVRPVGLFFWGRAWSMAAWCELRQGWRNFRVDRMDALEVLEQYEDTEAVSLQAFVRHQEESGELRH